MNTRMSSFLLKKFNQVEKIHWWWEGRRELLKNLIGRSNKNIKILDVGCGTGETLTFVNKIYPNSDLYGIDNSDMAIKYAKSRGHKKIYKRVADKLKFQSNFFDYILFLDVLEHIEDDQKAINEAKRVLKKGGKIIITSPALSFIWSEHDTMQGHYRRYTRREVVKLAHNAGLKVDFISYFNFFLSFPIIIIRLIGKLNLFKKISSYDQAINYDIANYGVVNNLLKFIFVNEVRLTRYFGYPIGISVGAVLRK
ncbi:MAG: methyltransferase domain-containing protein [Microgenomates group bacterium]